MFKVYCTDPVSEQSHGHEVESLTEALRYSEGFRKLGMRFVVMVSENPDSIGKPGVDAIKDGKCPDGVEYTWVKRR